MCIPMKSGLFLLDAVSFIPSLDSASVHKFVYIEMFSSYEFILHPSSCFTCAP